MAENKSARFFMAHGVYMYDSSPVGRPVRESRGASKAGNETCRPAAAADAAAYRRGPGARTAGCRVYSVDRGTADVRRRQIELHGRRRLLHSAAPPARVQRCTRVTAVD